MKGRCLNRLTMEPKDIFHIALYEKTPRVGLEPTTPRLTAECSTIELSRNMKVVPSKPHTVNTFFIRVSQTILAYSRSFGIRFASSSCLLLRKCLSANRLCPRMQAFFLHSRFRPAALKLFGQAFDLLVTVSSIHYCTSTSALSTSSSSRGLIAFAWDISS